VAEKINKRHNIECERRRVTEVRGLNFFRSITLVWGVGRHLEPKKKSILTGEEVRSRGEENLTFGTSYLVSLFVGRGIAERGARGRKNGQPGSFCRGQEIEGREVQGGNQ